MPNVTNPTGFTITDAVAAAQQVTGVTIIVGVATGGPYTAGTFPLTAAEVAAGLAANGVFTGTLASIGENLPPGTYFAVATATNAAGVSKDSPEIEFTVLAAPTAPTGFSVA